MRKTMRTDHKPLSTAIFAIVLGGFGCSVNTEPDLSGDPEDPYNTFFTETLVELSPDGNHKVLSVNQVSLAQQIANRELEARGESHRLNPGSCSDTNDLRIWDADNYTGHCLALEGTGCAALSTWCRTYDIFFNCTDWWGGSGVDDIDSFKTGNDDAIFTCTAQYWCQDTCTFEYGSFVSVSNSTHEGSTHVGRSCLCNPG